MWMPEEKNGDGKSAGLSMPKTTAALRRAGIDVDGVEDLMQILRRKGINDERISSVISNRSRGNLRPVADDVAELRMLLDQLGDDEQAALIKLAEALRQRKS